MCSRSPKCRDLTLEAHPSFGSSGARELGEPLRSRRGARYRSPSSFRRTATRRMQMPAPRPPPSWTRARTPSRTMAAAATTKSRITGEKYPERHSAAQPAMKFCGWRLRQERTGAGGGRRLADEVGQRSTIGDPVIGLGAAEHVAGAGRRALAAPTSAACASACPGLPVRAGRANCAGRAATGTCRAGRAATGTCRPDRAGPAATGTCLAARAGHATTGTCLAARAGHATTRACSTARARRTRATGRACGTAAGGAAARTRMTILTGPAAARARRSAARARVTTTRAGRPAAGIIDVAGNRAASRERADGNERSEQGNRVRESAISPHKLRITANPVPPLKT